MAVSAIAAAVATGGAAVATSTFTTAFLVKTFATNFVLSAAAKALSPKPSLPSHEPQNNTVTVRAPTETRKLIYGKTRVGGTIMYLETTGSDNKFLHMVIALAPHEIDSLEKVFFEDNLVYEAGSVKSDWSSYVRLNFFDGTQTSADPDLVSDSSSWTNDHILNGIAYISLRLEYDQDKFPTGIPNISAVVRGKPVFDPRTSSTSFSNNPALCIRDYLLDSKYGLDVDASEINEASFIAAANLCEEEVIASAGEQDRYTLDGVADTANTPKDNIDAMLTSLGGYLTYADGQFFLYGSEYRPPINTIDEDVITGPIQVQTRRSRRETFNAVKGVFSSEDDNYISADYPSVISSFYALEDGDPVYLDVGMPFVTNAIRAQRLAKLNLLRSRKQISASIPCNLSAMKLKAGDTIMVTNLRFGWNQKVFEVVNWSFQITKDGSLGVSLNVIETSEDVYDWTTDDESDFIAGPPTTITNPFTVQAPSNLLLTTDTLIQSDGTARPAIAVQFTNNDAFAVQFEIQYQKDSGSSQSILTRETSYRIEDIAVGSSYTIKVRAINRLGVRSLFAQSTIDGEGDQQSPDAPSDLSATGQFGGIYLQWTNPVDSDLDVIQIYESNDSIRGNATLIASVKSNSYIRGGLGDGVTRFYWAKAIDYSGNISGFNSVDGASATTLITLQPEDITGTIEVVGSLTLDLGADDIGKVEFLETDQKLYRWDGSNWITGVTIDDVAGSITANRLDVATLSSITANIGSVTAGSLIGPNQRFQINLNDNVLKIFDENGILRVRLGDLTK